MPLFLAPSWFKDTYIGIEVEQFIGIGVLVLVAAVCTCWPVRLYGSTCGRDWPRKTASSGSGAVAAEARAPGARRGDHGAAGLPHAGFDASVEHVVNQIASLFGAVALVLLGFGGIDIFTNVLKQRAAKTESASTIRSSRSPTRA